MIKKNKNIIDSISFNFNIWGINSPLEDYRLCWLLNKILDWKLKRVDDIAFYQQKEKRYINFNAYKYVNELDFYTIEIIKNKHDGNILIPEMKNFDYIFLFQGEEDYFNKDEITQVLKQIKGIQSIFEIDIENIKTKYNLLMRHFNDKQK
ncbi:MAG: IPExxxVDY family protein [Sphingobacteriales bacterium]|nr:MAG: IPExxxVDY family protein [Sphingobacteriales bacterium]